MKILTAAQIREIDQQSIDDFGIPGILLMENAGMRVVEAMESRIDDFEECTVGILCGKGNNGGDGFVVARQLIQRGIYPFVFLFGREADVTGDAKTNLAMLKAIGYPPTVITDEDEWDAEKLELLDADVIVDAILGTGCTKPATGLYGAAIDSINNDFPRATVVSIDVPSGLASDSGQRIGPAVEADFTVTFTALKLCLVQAPSQQLAGDVIVAEIGNPHELLEAPVFQLNLITSEDFPDALHPRQQETNKGDYGKVLVVGGSMGKSGAIAMAGQAALRSGAGLTTAAVPASILPVVAASMPELMTEALEESDEGAIAMQSIAPLLTGKTVLAIGPGLGGSPFTQAWVRAALREASMVTVVDADGLNAFVGHIEELRGTSSRPVIVTPHPGEMARLIGEDVDVVMASRIRVARDFAVNQNLHVVLKGFRTVVATPDASVYINATGNPGMATGGTGDILTGMIAGIVAQEHLGSLVERLCLAVYLHGLAGDIAAEEIGEEVMVATDILRFLSDAWEQVRQ